MSHTPDVGDSKPLPSAQSQGDDPDGFIELLRLYQVLLPAQYDELTRMTRGSTETGKSLARELIQRGWLTAFQANQLFQGKGQDLLLGSYLLMERLGEGGMGQVFKARQRLMNRMVALKVIRKSRLGSPGAADRFLREIQAVAHLSHPNIVIAHDAGSVSEVLFFSMEWVPGADLEQVIKRQGSQPLAAGLACSYVRQAALGLQHAHERGLIHRDVKPANLLLSEKDGVVKILDMGLARFSHPEVPTSGELTQDGSLMGTPDYIAPEQAMDCHSADARADIYSLGCTLYFLLAGKAPFADRPLAQKIGAHMNHQPRAIEELRPDLPAGLGAVLRQMMQKRCEDRYQTAAAVANALAPFAVVNGNVAAMPVPAAIPYAQSGEPTVAVEDGYTPEVVNKQPDEPRPISAQPGHLTRRQLLIGGAVAAATLAVPAYYLFRSPPGLNRKTDGPEAVPRYAWYPRELVRVLGDDSGRHWGPVRYATYRADGKVIVSCGDDAILRFWDAETFREIRPSASSAELDQSFRGHTASIRQVRFSPDGGSVISLGNDSTMRLWDVKTGKSVRAYAGSENIYLLHFSPSGHLVRGATSNQLRSWDLKEGDQQNISLPTTNTTYNCMDLLTGGKKILLAETTPSSRSWYQVNIFNTETLAIDQTLAGPEKPTGFLDLRPADQAKIQVQYLTMVSGSDDGRYVLGVSNSGELLFWDVASPTRVATLAKAGSATLARLSPDGKLAVGYHPIGGTTIWETPSGQKRGDLVGHKGPVVHITFSPDGSRALTCSEDRTLRQWDLKSCTEVSPRVGHTHLIEDVTFSPNRKQVLTGGADRTMRLWQADSGKQLQSFEHKTGVISVGFVPGGEEICSCETAGFMRRWNVADGRLVFNFDWLHNVPTVWLYLREKPEVWVGYAPNFVYRRNLISGNYAAGFVTLNTVPTCLVPSKDGLQILHAGADPIVRLVEIQTGKELRRYGGHTDRVFAVAFSPDGTQALSAGNDRRLFRWNLQGDQQGKAIELAAPLPKTITSMTFSPDTTLLACTGHNDHEGVVILWETTHGQERSRWRMPGPVQRLAFADDSEHFATANANGTVYLYHLDRSKKD